MRSKSSNQQQMESKNINVFLTIFYIEMFGVFIYKINPLTNQVFDLVLDFNLLHFLCLRSLYSIHALENRHCHNAQLNWTELKQNSFIFQTQSKYFHSDEQRNWFPTVVLPTHFKPSISIQWAHGKYLAIYLLIFGFQEDTGISLDLFCKHIRCNITRLCHVAQDVLPIF